MCFGQQKKKVYKEVHPNDQNGGFMVHPTDFILEYLGKLPTLIRPYNKLRKRYLYHQLKEKIDSYLSSGRGDTVIVSGLRGTGKTTILAQLYFYGISKINPNEVIYLSLDELQLLGLDLLEVLDTYKRIIKPERPILLLDEVQYEKNWDLKLKVIHDKMKFLTIATGSSAVKLREIPDLARRALHRELYPMTFREYYSLKTGREIPELIHDILSLKEVQFSLIDEEEIVRYMKVGGLPFALEMPEWEAYERVLSMLDRIIYRDLREIHDFDTETLDKAIHLLVLLANPKGERFSYERLSKSLNLAKGTIIKLIDSLEKASLIHRIPAHGSIVKGIRKSPKIKFLAVPVKSAILYKIGLLVDSEEVLGSLLEDIVAFYLHLLTKLRMGRLSYELARGGADFVLELGDEKIVIEVGLGKAKKSQVKRTMERIGAEKGIVIGKKYEVGERVAFYPWQMFMMGF